MDISKIYEKFTLSYPLKDLNITQPFGANYVGFYKTLGMSGHNGLDLKAKTGTPCYAVCDGTIKSYADSTGGIAVELFTDAVDIDGKKTRLKITYYHLQRYLVKTGDRVKKGQIIALCDNTGKYTTGAHLHFGVKHQYLVDGVWTQDNNNGYRGSIDPMPLLESDPEALPVDSRYGKPRNWLAEFLTRFKTKEIHLDLIRFGRSPDSLTDRETNALTYGGWEVNDLLNPAMWVTWTKSTNSIFRR